MKDELEIIRLGLKLKYGKATAKDFLRYCDLRNWDKEEFIELVDRAWKEKLENDYLL